MNRFCLVGGLGHRARHHCWGGHLFASNVGVLPTVPDACTLSPRLILSVPTKDLGRKLKRRRRRLRRELLRCDINVTRDVAPTSNACVQRR
jgi:hypothetical protein